MFSLPRPDVPATQRLTPSARLLSAALLALSAATSGCAGTPGGASTAAASSNPPPGTPAAARTAAAQVADRTNAAAGPAPNPALPPVPVVAGAPLTPRVQYPSENQVIASRDSNFILGSVGSGDATLTINGHQVQVAPNGAYIGWLPNPPASNPSYELVVARGADTVRRVLRIRYPARSALSSTGKLRVDSASVSPGSQLRVRTDEMIRVSVRAPLNATAWLQLDSGKHPMALALLTQASADRIARGETTVLSFPPTLTGDDVGSVFVVEVSAQRLNGRSRIFVARGADTVRLNVTAPQLVDPLVRSVGILRSRATIESDTDRVVIGRPVPAGTYKWLLLPGTIVEQTGRQGDFTRVRLDTELEVWVETGDIASLPEGTPLSRRVTGGMRVSPAKEWADVIIPMGERPPLLVEANGGNLVVTLYGTTASPDISPILGNDTLVRQIAWEQVTSDRVRIELRLSQQVYGWLTLWDEARRALVIRVRRLPNINKDKPLLGMVVAVDPGHPPAGSTGPTGLYEGDAVLPVGVLVAQLLREKGAEPVMTRTSLGPVGLTERGVTARRANANAFVSIHLNAFGDGTNPFMNNGTSTLFFHHNSEPLARPVQRELMKRLGLRDLGVHYQNLAVARPTWYPSVLAEGAFVIIPEQEAALRNPVYQRKYAEGIVAGLEAYFRELGQR
ncbi:MAG: N-acetylmuramoyl-L-alanine amidase [Phycisphaerae bacterium]|nr:N-acetylmuramoyl-L-alanine amidase [Gemmatimonadaceae bacterium]